MEANAGNRQPFLQAHSLQAPSQWSNASHLIVVAGHTVYVGTDMAGPQAETEKEWYLLDYQKGQLAWFLSHIKRGVELAAADEASLLVFSGGASRIDAGPRSEASAYWLYADAHRWFSKTERDEADVRRRSHTEEFARDSFENLLYSICRFKQLSGNYPSRITVVSLPFKERRFSAHHRAALRFPRSRFAFDGVGGSPPAAVEGEVSQSLKPYETDPYGCHGALAEKRQQRDPFRRAEPYPKGCHELDGLFQAASCAAEIYRGPLPWDP